MENPDQEIIEIPRQRKLSTKTVTVQTFNGIENFRTDEFIDSTNCGLNKVCIKFVIIAFISVSSFILGATLLIIDKFKTKEVSLIATNLISLNVSLWLKSPEIYNNQNEVIKTIEKKEENID